tara:strand:- start:273 stop:566 length:294 start_codon:yes stop_codon:yes gene_type:complete
MERHDIELKEREESVINVTNESSLVISFELEIYFDYKGTEFGAYCTYEIEGRGICDIGIYLLNSAEDVEESLHDELYEQVKKYFQEDFYIDRYDLQW